MENKPKSMFEKGKEKLILSMMPTIIDWLEPKLEDVSKHIADFIQSVPVEHGCENFICLVPKNGITMALMVMAEKESGTPVKLQSIDLGSGPIQELPFDKLVSTLIQSNVRKS